MQRRVDPGWRFKQLPSDTLFLPPSLPLPLPPFPASFGLSVCNRSGFYSLEPRYRADQSALLVIILLELLLLQIRLSERYSEPAARAGAQVYLVQALCHTRAVSSLQ